MSKHLILASSIAGAVLGMAVGYIVFALSWKGFHADFAAWMFGRGAAPEGSYLDALVWAIIGIVLVNAATFIFKKNSN